MSYISLDLAPKKLLGLRWISIRLLLSKYEQDKLYENDGREEFVEVASQ